MLKHNWNVRSKSFALHFIGFNLIIWADKLIWGAEASHLLYKKLYWNGNFLLYYTIGLIIVFCTMYSTVIVLENCPNSANPFSSRLDLPFIMGRLPSNTRSETIWELLKVSASMPTLSYQTRRLADIKLINHWRTSAYNPADAK